MRRRLLLFGWAALAAAGGRDVRAQSPAKPAVIGRLHPGSPTDSAQIKFMQGFRDGMRSLGYIEGQSYRIEARYAEGDTSKLPALAAELVEMKADAIITIGTSAAQAAKAVTASIPVVMAMSGADPVALGLVNSLTRPGGNVTGFSGLIEELSVKQLEILRETVPDLTDVVVLFNPAAANAPSTPLSDAAKSMSLRLHLCKVSTSQDVDAAMAARDGGGRTGVIVLPDPTIIDRLRAHISTRALQERLPTASSFRITAEAGALLSYAEDLTDMHRRSASFVDKILRGAKPADLPVEQPAKFELILNLKTARALQLDIPPQIIARADEVIE
jgi:putative tryptophan/tyrosine transport system substrate-binding protein